MDANATCVDGARGTSHDMGNIVSTTRLVREGDSFSPPKTKEKKPRGYSFFDDDSPLGTTFDDSPAASSMSFASRSVATSPMMNAVEEPPAATSEEPSEAAATESSALASGSPEAASANAGAKRLDATARYTSEARVTVLAKGGALLSVILRVEGGRGRGAFVKRWGGLVG